MQKVIKTLLLFMFLSTSNFVFSQKQLTVYKTSEPVKIDGVLDDKAWENAEVADQFMAFQPSVDLVPTTDTEVKMTYDDKAIYISAFLHEVSRDSIMTEMSQRDNIGNTDWFGILLDTYSSGIDGLEFIVQSTGVQFDAKLGDNGDDESWDSIWESEVVLTDKGWTVEMAIPYAAIRFPNVEVQEWKINFIKYHARTGEKSLWSPFDPEKNGFLRQFGDLHGLKGIKTPVRLSVSPYASTYYNIENDKGDITNTFSYNGGMDLKYGLNDAFTLDMTLVPDFGAVTSDDLVLNLSPFEVRYDENRQFFTEGIELFEKGNLFYSRRIGSTPIDYYQVSDDYENHETEILVDNPIKSKLLNASKISGRNSNGLGIGFFNAVSGESFATVKHKHTKKERKIRTSPWTNYNLIVLDQILKNNSFVSFSNSSVLRTGPNHYNAIVTAGQFDLKNEKQSVNVNGGGKLSQLYYPSQDNEFGHQYEFGVRKIGGKHTYGLYYEETSNTYDPNDLGFLSYNNERNVSLSTEYQLLEKTKYYTRGNLWFNADYARLYSPNVYTNTSFNLGFWVQTLGLWSVNGWMNFSPKGYDYYETRADGRYFFTDPTGETGIWIGSDDRKKFQMNSMVNVYGSFGIDRHGYAIRLAPRYRFSDKISVNLISSFNQLENGRGYVDESSETDDIYFGKRDRTTLTNIANLTYNITNRMGLDFKLRHYWSKVSYDGFYSLLDNGRLGATEYDDNNDFAYNVFSLDFVYKWRFSPGSDMIFTWKNNIEGASEDQNINYKTLDYFEGIDALNEFANTNSVSIKIVYFLDYNSLFSRSKS